MNPAQKRPGRGNGTGPATSRNNPGTGSSTLQGGPGVHNILQPAKNDTVAANQPLLVRWSVPSRAKSAELETKDFATVTLADTGSYRIPGIDNPARPDQRIRVFRFNEVDIAGGLIGSRLRVKVRKSVQPVVVR